MPSDIVEEARNFLNFGAPSAWSDQPMIDELVNHVPGLLRALADEVERLRKQTPELRQRERKRLFTVIDIRGCDKCDLCEDHQ